MKTPLRLKSKLQKACAYPALTYGAQMWATTHKQLNKIYRTQLAMEHSVTGKKLKDRVCSSKIRNLMGTKTELYRPCQREHNEDRWEKRVFEWTPYGKKRGKGRPKKWEEEIIRMGGIRSG